jgi:hypothetical protein
LREGGREGGREGVREGEREGGRERGEGGREGGRGGEREGVRERCIHTSLEDTLAHVEDMLQSPGLAVIRKTQFLFFCRNLQNSVR